MTKKNIKKTVKNYENEGKLNLDNKNVIDTIFKSNTMPRDFNYDNIMKNASVDNNYPVLSSNHINKKLEKMKNNDNFSILLNNSNKIESLEDKDLIYPQSYFHKSQNSVNQSFAASANGNISTQSNKIHIFDHAHQPSNSFNIFGSNKNRDPHSCTVCENVYKEAVIYNKNINIKQCLDCLNKINPKSLDFYMNKYHNELLNAQKTRLEKMMKTKNSFKN